MPNSNISKWDERVYQIQNYINCIYGQNKNIFIIYSIINKINGKIYIGKTFQAFYKRMGQHKKSFFSNKNTYLIRTVQKYGIENFDIKIIESFYNFDDLKLQYREDFWIKFYNTRNSEFGYNCKNNNPDENGHCFNDEIRIKQSISRKKYCDNPEVRIKMSVISKENWSNPEYREKMSVIRKKYWSDPKYREKITNTDVHEKISKSMKNYFSDPQNLEKHKIAMQSRHIDPLKQEEKYIKMRKKEFSIISPDGIIWNSKDIKNITHFCKDHNISKCSLYQIIDEKIKSCKGWTLYKENSCQIGI